MKSSMLRHTECFILPFFGLAGTLEVLEGPFVTNIRKTLSHKHGAIKTLRGICLAWHKMAYITSCKEAGQEVHNTLSNMNHI
jgi:hypothetical protein